MRIYPVIVTLRRLLETFLNHGYSLHFRNLDFLDAIFGTIQIASVPCAILLMVILCTRRGQPRQALLRRMGLSLCLLYVAVAVAILALFHLFVFLEFSAHDSSRDIVLSQSVTSGWTCEIVATWAVLSCAVVIAWMTCEVIRHLRTPLPTRMNTATSLTAGEK